MLTFFSPTLVSPSHPYSMDQTGRRRGGGAGLPLLPSVNLSLSAPRSPFCHCLLVSLHDTVSVFPIYLSPPPSPPLCLALSPSSLHLSGRVIEPCVPSLSAKRLADCLHFHAEGCKAGVAVVRAIDWDPSKPLPVGKLPPPPPLLVGAAILSLSV